MKKEKNAQQNNMKYIYNKQRMFTANFDPSEKKSYKDCIHDQSHVWV